MKFKKAFAWILAVAMVITLMPSMAFATSTNTVKAVPTVASNSEMPATSISVEVKDTDWNDGATMRDQTIKLNFTNAKWNKNPKTEGASISPDGSFIEAVGAIADDPNTTENEAQPAKGLTVTASAIEGTFTDVNFKKVLAVSDNSIEFEFEANGTVKKGTIFTFTFNDGALKSESESGPVEIAIDGLDSYVSSSTLTVATVGSNNTVASVSGSVKTYGRLVDIPIDAIIELRETAVNSISGPQVIKLTLPKGMSWSQIEIGGSLTNPVANILSGAAAIDPDHVNATNKYYLGNDGRSAYIYLDVTPDDKNRQVATFKSKITIGKTASEGDITVDIASHKAISGNSISEASDLVIGAYGSESVKISTADEEKLPVIYSGYEETNKGKSTWVQLTIEESVRDSLVADRYIDVEFPEEIQVVSNAAIKATLSNKPNISDASTYGNLTGGLAPDIDDKDRSEFTLTVPGGAKGNSVGKDTWDNNKANKWTLFVPVTIRADFTGDIEATLKGGRAGIEDTTIVVGKAESPIKVETKTTEVRNGVQSQALADITITENVAGYLDANSNKNEVVLDIDTLNLSGTSLTAAKVEVTEGDLEIKNVKKRNNKLTFEIKEESTKPSTISITGVVAALNRTLPEGPYALQVYGSALVQNGPYDDGDFNDPDHDGNVCAAKVADYIKIVTPADPSTMENKINATFVLRQDTFTNNGETVKMDTAPYLDANNRTQLPIRYAAIACGVDEKDISWDQASQTATINGKNVVLRITIGSNIMQTSNGNITMDTAAVSSNGRIFVPIRYIANALGAEVGWNYDTKTITLTN